MVAWVVSSLLGLGSPTYWPGGKRERAAETRPIEKKGGMRRKCSVQNGVVCGVVVDEAPGSRRRSVGAVLAGFACWKNVPWATMPSPGSPRPCRPNAANGVAVVYVAGVVIELDVWPLRREAAPPTPREI